MTIHIGITGTREGCTSGQLEELSLLFDARDDASAGWAWFHFGDCVGVDEQAFHLAKYFGYATVAHPPSDSKLRAWCDADVLLEPRPYMDRNKAIVDSVKLLIVVPSGPEADNPRSGTWATYRMAVKAGVETVVIEP